MGKVVEIEVKRRKERGESRERIQSQFLCKATSSFILIEANELILTITGESTARHG